MKKFHVCYIVAKGLCTGINIQAVDYIDAVLNFNTIHGGKAIIYVQEITT